MCGAVVRGRPPLASVPSDVPRKAGVWQKPNLVLRSCAVHGGSSIVVGSMAITTKSRLEGSPESWANRRLVVAGVLAVAALLAYANSFSVPLLFDDWATILHNPRLRQVWPLWSALSPPEATGVGGRPIANLSFVLNYALTGESIPGFHAINLAIHFLAGLTLFGIVRRTLDRLTASPNLQRRAAEVALAVAAWWMLHPVQTQSVTYVSQRTESLMGLFFFFTLYAFIRATEPGGARGWLVAAVASSFAGMATKEGMVTIPVIVLLYDYAFLSGSFVTALRRRWPIYAALAASWILLALLMGGLHGRGVGFGLGMTWWSYLLIECRAIAHYLSLTFWPTPLVFDYGTDLGTPGFAEALAAVGLGALGVGTLVALWRAPAIGFLGAWFLITLSPTSSVVPIPLQPISENRIYVPTVAAIVALVIAVQHVIAPRRVVALLVAAVALGVMTVARNRDYRSEIAIWADTVAKCPTSARAHSNLGHALQEAGRLDEARQQHEIALRLRPRYAEAHMNIGAILGRLGDREGAIEHSRRALEIDPQNANANFNLGVALTQKGQIAEAIAHYEAALRVNNEAPTTHSNLALLLLRQGRADEAILHSSAALRLQPGLIMARYGLGCGLALLGRNEEALAVFQETLRIQPTHLETLQACGTLLLQLGRPAEAAGIFESAVRINPNHADAHLGWGNALLAQGQFPAAIGQYEAALTLNPQLAKAHLNLGIALGKSGRGRDAVAHLETALRLDPQLKLAEDILRQLRAASAAPKR